MTNHALVADYFPKAYDGKVKVVGGREMTIIEVATLCELPPIMVRYGEWAVTREGISCLVQEYDIPKDRFDENWLSHMEEKTWVNIQDFHRAFSDAKQMVALGII